MARSNCSKLGVFKLVPPDRETFESMVWGMQLWGKERGSQREIDAGDDLFHKMASPVSDAFLHPLLCKMSW